MQSRRKNWLDATAAWHNGIRTDNWTVIGQWNTPPPAAAMEQGWSVEDMNTDLAVDPAVDALSCLARDESGQYWFISKLGAWCATVPLPPRVLTPEEKIGRARMDKSDKP